MSKAQNHSVIVELALNKPWTKLASYWIRLLYWETEKLNFFAVERKWHFKKQGEVIEGQTESRKYTSLKEAVDLFLEYSQEKIVRGAYLNHGLAFAQSCDYKHLDLQIMRDRVTAEVMTYLDDQQKIVETQHKKMREAHPTPTASKPKPAVIKKVQPKPGGFKAAVSKRKRNAEW